MSLDISFYRTFPIAAFNQALSKLKFSSAIRTKIYMNCVVCDQDFPVSPVFKKEAVPGKSLLDICRTISLQV